MTLKDILKDYGTLVGSFLGFLFAVMALFVKYLFDTKTNRWNTNKKLKKLKKIIDRSEPPTLEKSPEIVEGVFYDFPTILRHNVALVTVYGGKINYIMSFSEKVETDVVNYTSDYTIEKFFVLVSTLKLLNDNINIMLDNLRDLNSMVKDGTKDSLKNTPINFPKENELLYNHYNDTVKTFYL